MHKAAPYVDVPSRQCSIDIQNKSSTYLLTDPLPGSKLWCSPGNGVVVVSGVGHRAVCKVIHLVSGFSEIPLPPTLKPSEAGSALFVKSSIGFRGSVGVFTYDLVHESKNQNLGKLAVMFSVPYDFNLYSNWYAVGMFGREKLCDQKLFDEMYKEGEKGLVRGKAKGPSLTFRGDRVTIRATMSNSYKPVLKVDLCDN